MVSERLSELEEVSKELLKVLLEDWAGARLRRSLEKRSRAEERLLAAQGSAARLVTELAALEEAAARSLLERQEELRRCRQRGRELQEEMEAAREAAGSLRASNWSWRSCGSGAGGCRRRASGRTTGVPSAAYVTQLYYKISRIDWDYEAEPEQIKGIHYGPDIAQPISMDGSRHSRCFIADYLWSLVPTAW